MERCTLVFRKERAWLFIGERACDFSPSKSFVELADDLGSGDVAAVQLEWSYLDDAKLGGTVEHCARDFLARALREHLPNG